MGKDWNYVESGGKATLAERLQKGLFPFMQGAPLVNTIVAKARALDKRRKSIRNIRKITRTMELIATARFKKAMDRATAASAYTQKIKQLVSDLADKPSLRGVDSGYMPPPPPSGHPSC